MANRQSILKSASAQGLDAIDADLERNRRSWRTYLDAERCAPRRRALLQEAAALPIETHADAAGKLRIALRHGSGAPRSEWGDARIYFSGIVPAEERPIFELCLQVFEWLDRQTEKLPQIRAALLGVRHDRGGDLHKSAELGLSDNVQELVVQLPATIDLLEFIHWQVARSDRAPEPPVGTVTLSPEAAVQVRAAMLEVLAFHGQRLVEECEPGLDWHACAVAQAMRRAIRLLDSASGRAS
jgi:hypothetical protein